MGVYISRKILKNKPLVEAIFQMRWKLQKRDDGARIDPQYKLLLGLIYDKVKADYPFHEQLNTATIPDELAGYVIQHRFRKEKDDWPLIQIGPGILTVNDTHKYVWEDFEKRIVDLVNTFFEVYQTRESKPVINQLSLRYIDAIAFDYEKDDIYDFLNEKMKMNVRLYPKLFENSGVEVKPLGFDVNFSFKSAKPKGAATLRFSKGIKEDGTEGLIWNTIVVSKADDANKNSEEILQWIKDAHNLTDKWFFMIIEGELLKSFE